MFKNLLNNLFSKAPKNKNETYSLNGFLVEVMYDYNGTFKNYLTKIKRADGAIEWVWRYDRSEMASELKNAVKEGASPVFLS